MIIDLSIYAHKHKNICPLWSSERYIDTFIFLKHFTDRHTECFYEVNLVCFYSKSTAIKLFQLLKSCINYWKIGEHYFNLSDYLNNRRAVIGNHSRLVIWLKKKKISWPSLKWERFQGQLLSSAYNSDVATSTFSIKGRQTGFSLCSQIDRSCE